MAARDGGSKITRAAVEDYQGQLLPLAHEWGRIEIQGMRPAIRDLETPDEGVPPEAIAAEADAWHEALVGLREKIQQVEAPGILADASRLFDESIVKYIEAAKVFADAARQASPQREEGVDKGVKLASDGARIYNDASLVLQRARREAGLPPTSDFPNEPAGPRIID